MYQPVAKNRRRSCTRELSKAHLWAVGLSTFPTPPPVVNTTELKMTPISKAVDGSQLVTDPSSFSKFFYQ